MNYGLIIQGVLIVAMNLLTASATPIEKVLVIGGTSNIGGRSVSLADFAISRFEITNEQYVLFLNAKQVGATAVYKDKVLLKIESTDLKLRFIQNQWQALKGFGNYPVVMVNYYGALAFCEWAGGTLPTEAEWIYAAAGGQHSRNLLYAGSDMVKEVGWVADNSDNQLHLPGTKRPNELGLYDLSGNVWEWCRNDSLKSDSGFCVHKGGSWYAGEMAARISSVFGNSPLHFSNSVGFRVIFHEVSLFLLKDKMKGYSGKPWSGSPQQIPGILECEWFDRGGEGIAYHDNDSVNNGSGRLNPPDGSFLNEFRMKEGVDISYTKANGIDNSPYNVKEPEMNRFYAGWTWPGEWINYTVNVNQSGLYRLSLQYTASGDGGIQLLVDGESVTGELRIASTRNAEEQIPWRQWHHWNRIDSLTTVQLVKGIHVFTLYTVTHGNMNYDYLKFDLLPAK